MPEKSVPDKALALVNSLVSAIRGLNYFLSESTLFWVSKRLHRPKVEGLVSIPIATYDRIDTLVHRTLPALFAQTYSKLEIIVVTDGTPKAHLRPLAGVIDPRLKVVSLKRRSRYPKDPKSLWMVAGYRPRNIGARKVQGEFILWMSDDDELLPDAVESLVRYLQENIDIDAAGGSYERPGIELKANTGPKRSPEPGYDYGAMPGWLWRSYLKVFKWNGQSYKKSWDRPSDFDLARRMKRAGVRFGAIDQLVALQHPSPGTGLFGSQAAIHEELERRDRK